ncbi:MAG: SGNH/GDSL hydrolase family protein, partial [Ruminococcaceae bacterium]|nr:SGNH/GDSL hydrolase family protein [Oscillospiraceae bacterium]
GGAGHCFFYIIEMLAKQYEFNYIKEAVSGTTLVDIGENSYVSRLKKRGTDFKIDLFVCQLSTNDASRKLSISSVEEAIRFIVHHVKSNFGCPIAFYTNTYYDDACYAEMVQLIKRLSTELGLYVINLYEDEEMRAISAENRALYMKDRIHPTLKGYEEWWTPKFAEFFEKI